MGHNVLAAERRMQLTCACVLLQIKPDKPSTIASLAAEKMSQNSNLAILHRLHLITKSKTDSTCVVGLWNAHHLLPVART